MANRLAGGDLDDIVALHVASGKSWSAISRTLKADHGVEVTRVTLAKWYGHLSPTVDDDEAVA